MEKFNLSENVLMIHVVDGFYKMNDSSDINMHTYNPNV